MVREICAAKKCELKIKIKKIDKYFRMGLNS
jgi:hypothetical protein